MKLALLILLVTPAVTFVMGIMRFNRLAIRFYSDEFQLPPEDARKKFWLEYANEHSGLNLKKMRAFCLKNDVLKEYYIAHTLVWGSFVLLFIVGSLIH